MTTDFRALCAELLADFEYVCREYKVPLQVAMMKARAALAEGAESPAIATELENAND